MGFAVAARSTGAIAPLMEQKAAPPLGATLHRGSLSVTAETGSPMAVTGMLLPSLAAVQSASVIVCEPAGVCALTAEEQINAAALRRVQKRECFIVIDPFPATSK
jgi:hypothetical protein